MGNVIENVRSGKGFRLYCDGKVYIGHFKQGVKDGHGILLDKDGNLLYEGMFFNDLMNGQGKLILPDNLIYQGEMENDKISGKSNSLYFNMKDLVNLFILTGIFTLDMFKTEFIQVLARLYLIMVTHIKDILKMGYLMVKAITSGRMENLSMVFLKKESLSNKLKLKINKYWQIILFIHVKMKNSFQFLTR